MTPYEAKTTAIWASELKDSCELYSALKNVSVEKPVTITVIDSNGKESNIKISTCSFLRDILWRATDEAVQKYEKLIMEKIGG